MVISIDQGTLKLSHRHALVDPVVGTVGKLDVKALEGNLSGAFDIAKPGN